jgi:hypothetical protein
VHPFFIAGEGYGVFALKGSNLVVEAMLSPIKDSDTTLAGLLPGRICIDKMSRWCLVGEILGPLDPDIAFNI